VWHEGAREAIRLQGGNTGVKANAEECRIKLKDNRPAHLTPITAKGPHEDKFITTQPTSPKQSRGKRHKHHSSAPTEDDKKRLSVPPTATLNPQIQCCKYIKVLKHAHLAKCYYTLLCSAYPGSASHPDKAPTTRNHQLATHPPLHLLATPKSPPKAKLSTYLHVQH